MNATSTRKWFVLYTRSRFEKKIAEALAESGYEVYLPLVKTLRQWSDRKKKVEVPLFSSYVFIRSTHHKIKSVIYPPGVLTLLSFRGEAATVPDEQIESLRLLLATDEPFEVTTETFAPGDYVEILRGPLRGVKGIFTDYSSRKQVMITIDALHLSIAVSIDPSFITKTSEPVH